MKKILYVDDDEKTLRLVSAFLGERGYQVITSAIPFIAGIIKEQQPDLIILDLDMPLLPGDRLLQVLRHHEYTAGARILFFSGQSPEALRRAVMETGAAGAIPKSAGLDNLLAAVRDAIGSPMPCAGGGG